MTIDSRSDRPVYKQVADLLRAGIVSGRYPPGDVLPSENRLVQEYGIGREAVRQGIALLRFEGLVTTERGRGTAVRPSTQREPVKLLRGDRAIGRMPTGPERAVYGIEDGVPVLVITRLDGTAELHPGDRVEIVAGTAE